MSKKKKIQKYSINWDSTYVNLIVSLDFDDNDNKSRYLCGEFQLIKKPNIYFKFYGLYGNTTNDFDIKIIKNQLNKTKQR